MGEQVILTEETRSTIRHQITIPTKIWKKLGAKTGARFVVKLLLGNKMMVEEKTPDLDFSESDWTELKRLARSRKNRGKTFESGEEAKKYLRTL
jgi:bifunctional DNA-binding transcriptional regulator/antitoxin component of YhaV-PrlF toxin-antitoxin module